MHSMAWDLVTPETLLHIIIKNPVRCAKAVLEGGAPELQGLRAYPNCVTQYGFFPIHQAAEIFSVDMIRLLIRHGALVNLRTIGGEVIKGLLPLHVAVENTCMHKYLDDNMFPDEFNPDYSKAGISDVYKLIHLLLAHRITGLDKSTTHQSCRPRPSTTEAVRTHTLWL